MGRPRKVVLDDPINSGQLYPLGEPVEKLIESDNQPDSESSPETDSDDIPTESVYVPKTPYNTALFIKQGKQVCPKCGGQVANTINNEPRCNENLGMECPRIKAYNE